MLGLSTLVEKELHKYKNYDVLQVYNKMSKIKYIAYI